MIDFITKHQQEQPKKLPYDDKCYTAFYDKFPDKEIEVIYNDTVYFREHNTKYDSFVESNNKFDSIVEKASKLLDSRAEHITLLESKVEKQKQTIKEQKHEITAYCNNITVLEGLLAKERGKKPSVIMFPSKFLPEAEQAEGTILKVNKEYGIRLHIAPFLGNNWIMYKVYHNGKEKMLKDKCNKEGVKFYNIKGKRFYWKDMDKINWDYTYTKSYNTGTEPIVEKTSVSSEDMSLLHTILKCSETLYTKFNTL